MAENMNPALDTIAAVKNKTAGPIGVYTLVWSIYHAKIFAFIMFEVKDTSGVSEAEAKILAITSTLQSQPLWTNLGVPFLFTILALILTPTLNLLWHMVTTKFQYWSDKISVDKEFNLAFYRKYKKDADIFLTSILADLNSSLTEIKSIPPAGSQIHATSQVTHLQSTVTSMSTIAEGAATKLQVLVDKIETYR